MFTGIVQGIATVQAVADRPGLRSFTLRFPADFCGGLAAGASVAVDGVCLTVTGLRGSDEADFDIMQQSLALTTLGELVPGSGVNVERAARDGAEIGGHPLSGHVDFKATLAEVREPENNRVLRIAVPAPWMRYVFAKGYIAVNGASLTVSEAQREPGGSGWFEVWLIPETLRMTTFGRKLAGGAAHRDRAQHAGLRGHPARRHRRTPGPAAAVAGRPAARKGPESGRDRPAGGAATALSLRRAATCVAASG
jgi:riboflavin synthase